jgi:glycosyltransferase involved in cell wall biosynthesis
MKEYVGRILMLVEDYFPEDVRVKNEAYTLTQAGYKVTVIALRKKGEKAKENVNNVCVYRLSKLKIFKKNGKDKTIFFAQIFHKLGSILGYLVEYFYFTAGCILLSLYILKKEGFDIIHAHNPPDTLFIIGKLYKNFGKKFIFDHHDLSPELYLSRFRINDGIVYRMPLKVEKISLQVADIVIATNESYKKIEIERGALDPENVYVVRNGPDLNRIKLTMPDEQVKSLKKKILGYVGEINPQDGLDYLLRAIRFLVFGLGRNDFYCIIIGKGDALEDMKALARELKIEEYIWFTGFISDDDMLRYLSTADICVDPDPSSPLNDVSTWIKIMEYMALAKPIVSFDLAETRFTAQEAAIYVDTNNEKEFAKAIVKLMDNPDQRIKMGDIGYKRIVNELAWQHVSKNLISAYDRLFDNLHNIALN